MKGKQFKSICNFTYLFIFFLNYEVRELSAKYRQGPMNTSRNPLNFELVIVGVL